MKKKYYNYQDLINTLENASYEKVEFGESEYLTRDEVIETLKETRFFNFDEINAVFYIPSCSTCSHWNRHTMDEVKLSTGGCVRLNPGSVTATKFNENCKEDYKYEFKGQGK
jgi:hypothetical protein